MKIKIIPFGDYKVERKHYNDAGADCSIQEDFILKPHETKAVPLGFGVQLPDGYVGYILPRSSIARKGFCVHPVPIDSGYTGEIHCIITNLNDYPFQFEKGDRLGQLVIQPCLICDFVDALGEERRDGAFGSTGK